MIELINYAFLNKIFPDDMKKLKFPLFSRKMMIWIRPISILVVFSKIFETIIAEQLMEYFTSIFDNMLCAYCKKYGTEHVLIKFIDSWKYALDNQNIVGTILMDLSKVFDCIPHGLLDAKMNAYGLSGDACEFMSSYLTGPFQRVNISDERSSWLPLLKGIPQGSSLGPFIFNVFMNDIFHFIETCDLTNYADDNTLHNIASTIEAVLSALSTDTKAAIDWFINNYMQANPSKFQFMFQKHFRCKVDVPDSIEIDTITIKCQSDVKCLEMTIDNKLRFNMHVNILCKSAARQLNVMYRFKNISDLKEKEKIYNTFILANFNYCLQFVTYV